MPVIWCWSMLRLILFRKIFLFRRRCCILLITSFFGFCIFLAFHSINLSQRTGNEFMFPALMPVQDSGRWKGNILTPMHQLNGRAPKQVVEVVQRTKQNVEEKDAAVLGTPSHSFSIKNKQQDSVLPSMPGVDSLKLLQNIILEHNKAPIIYNEDKFLPLGEAGLVLIVQVHKREKYLTLLLESLKAANGIEDVLLVISHDYYDDFLNKMVESIDFCRVIQIFYPLSFQVVPTGFPGASKKDCPRDATKKEALGMNCTNAHHPDSYGHYREAIITAIKHHWWWKINTVFDRLQATRNYNGYVFFLEEDHYVSPDFLAVAKQLIELKRNKCPDCDFINLGMYHKTISFSNRVNQGIWNAGKNNMGFGMDRSTWNLVRNCSKYFCSYDDYNWDWSINQLGRACPLIGRDLKVLVIRTPRVFHIGTCGTHHHRSCNELKEANAVRNRISKQSSNLFPTKLVLDADIFPPSVKRKLKAYGGWGDIRDHELCMKIAEGETIT